MRNRNKLTPSVDGLDARISPSVAIPDVVVLPGSYSPPPRLGPITILLDESTGKPFVGRETIYPPVVHPAP